MRIFPFLIIVLFSVDFGSSQHNPYEDPYICGLPTCSEGGKFKYGPGTEQNYKYSVQVSSLFNGTSRNESTLFLEGNVNLKFSTPCDGVLSLYDFTLKEKSTDDYDNPNSDLFRDSLSAYPLRFAFKDGNIHQICLSQEDTEWVVNFKKGILNMLHNTMKRFDLDFTTDETDVGGSCPTKYTVIGAKETSLLVKKTKDLNSCHGTGRIHSTVQTISLPYYSMHASKENLLKSTSECLLSIDHNIYNRITCEETHVLQAFSNQDSGATTSIKQELVLTDEVQTNFNGDDEEIYKRMSLNFDHRISQKPTTDDLTVTTKLAKELCKADKMQGAVDPSDTLRKFIYNLKTLSYDAIKDFYDNIGTVCPNARKHFLNALPYVSTGPSVILMKDIILQKTIPQNTVKDWVSSIAFIPDPTDEMLIAASELLQQTPFNHEIALSVTTLMHTYCTKHTKCREKNEGVDLGIQHLEKIIAESFHKNLKDRQTHDDIMVALKALSNVGMISEELYNQLVLIIEEPQTDPALRVAAIEVFRRSPCDESRRYFEKLYRNPDGIVEVRIAAYLQMMRCPDYLLIRTVRLSLLNEEVNQVGSFVWTHLNNLLTTANPVKVEIQSLVSDKDIIKKFSNDLRKFSRNFEGSTYFGDYDIGGSYESNIIFSPSSYVPKSAMLNLTTVLFGESVNLLEVYGRVDGVEHYLESFFGPKGTANDLKDNIMDHLRMPRSTNENDKLTEQVMKLPNVYADSLTEPKVSLGMKIFGNDLKYVTLNGEKEIQGAVQNLSPLYNLERILSGKEIIYNKEAMFLDSKYIVSTGAGLPLSLSATGTAMVNMKLYGSLTSSKLSQSKELEMDVTAKIEPTISVDITGEMAVDAFFASTGIKLKANMFTDTAIKSDIKIRGTRLVSARFSLPKKNNEIINARSELIVKQNNIEQLQDGISHTRVANTMCSWDAVEKTIGLKLCTSYKFANATKLDNFPSFLMAGPSSFRFFIHKADPTANVYLFEYRRTAALMSVVFDTPGSEVKRLLSGNLTLHKGMHNLTVVLQSSEGIVLLKGKITNQLDVKELQFTVSINDKEHLDVAASLHRYNFRNGYVYKPTVYLAINRERIFTFKGNIDLLSKRGISQYTVDLKFETKRLHSKLFGYVSTTESSLEASLYSDYKFHRTKEQRLSIKFGVANRSPKNMVVIVGFCSLNSTAYPNLNIDSNATFQRSGSHMDLTMKLKQAPFPPEHPEAEFRTLTFDSVISYKTFTDTKRTWEARASLLKRSSNLDLNAKIIYEVFRHNVNVISEVKYGEDKKLLTTVLWSRPKQTLEDIKLFLNITAPTFTPMVVKVGVLEKQAKSYMIDFHGTWFSGHSMTALAFYNDKSNSLSSNHHAKILIRSPSFNDTKVDVFYFRDNNVFKLLFEANYNDQVYHFSTQHKSISNEETHFQATIKYRNQVYKFVSNIYDGDYKKIDAEIHFDEYRDVAIWCYLLNEENNKTLGFKFNWDANRDPSQKLLVTANYRKNGDFNYISDFIMSYPGRAIKGDYKFSLERGHVNTLMRLSWDEGQTAGFNMDMFYDFERRLYFELTSQIYTPLDNWKLTNIGGKFEHLNNKYVVHGLISWDKAHKIELDFFGDYISSYYFWCRYSLAVSSSTDAIPNVNMTLAHTQNDTNLGTNVYFMYSPEFILAVDSYWKIESDAIYKNLTGTVQTKTPFSGLSNGALVSKIILKENKYLKGVADLDVNRKKMSINMEGKFKKITDCMLIINATSLDDHYQLKFLISTEKKHFVAMLTYPSGNLGTEVYMYLNNIIDFDIKLQLATPVEFLQNVLVIAKLQPEEAKFRATWNVLSLGFYGIWHYKEITDFAYVYKVFTPLKNFEENGVAAKFILDEGLDFEVSAQLSIYKLGLKLFGKEKPHHLQEIGIDLKELYSHSQLVDSKATVDDLRWEGAIEVDVIIYPTMKGVLELNQQGEKYFLQSKLTMPHGIAVLVNELHYHDILDMKNNMYITTPYITFKSISSDFELEIIRHKKYVFKLGMDYLNNTEVVKIGADVRYEAETKDIYDKSYNLSVHIVTPFKSFPKLNLLGTYESEENFYHPKIVFNTNSTDILIDTILEMDNGLVEISSKFFIITPTIYIPSTQLRFTKLFSPSKNYVEININTPEVFKREIYTKTSWVIRSKTDFETLFRLETPFSGLENTTGSLNIYISDHKSIMSTTLQMNPIDIEVSSTLQNNHLTAVSNLILKGKKYPIKVDCEIIDIGRHSKQFDGKLTLSGHVYNISGSAERNGDLYTKAYLKLTPQNVGLPIIFEYQIDQKSYKEFYMTGSIELSGNVDRYKAHLLAHQPVNWEFSLEIETSKKDKFFITSEATTVDHIINLVVNATTPIEQLEQITFNGNLNLTDIDKSANGHLKAGNVIVVGDVASRWKFLEDMLLIASGSASNGIFNKSSTIYGLFKNPNKAFTYLRLASDVRIDTILDTGLNATLTLPTLPEIIPTNVIVMGIDGDFKVPNGDGEVHSFNSYLDYTKGFKKLNYSLKYYSTPLFNEYGIWVMANTEQSQNMTGKIDFEWDNSIYENYGNLKMDRQIELLYKLKTPKYTDKQFFTTSIKYAPLKERYNVTLEAFHPEFTKVAFVTTDFAELVNMKGNFNITIPHTALNYTGADFDLVTNDAVINRYIKLFWQGNDALVDSKCKIERGPQLPDSRRNGTLNLEIPLKTRHIVKVDYNYDEIGQLNKGTALINYNGETLLESIYKCISESKAGLDKDTVHAELINKFWPIAADYVHKYEYGATAEDDTLDTRQLRVYHMRNLSKFDVSGEYEVHNVWGGKEYTITAVHANKTVKLMTDYTIFDQIFKQHSRIELNPSHWLEYEINIVNKTKDETYDAQEVILEVTYPQRSFAAKGSYNISDSIIISDASVEWDSDHKTVSGGLNWKKMSPHKDQLTILLKHPTFEKDVSFLGEYSYDSRNVDGLLIVDYSLNPDKRLTIKGKLSDTSDVFAYNYTGNLNAEHNATNLKFASNAMIFWNTTMFGNDHITKYQRSYLPESTSETLIKVNLDNNEIEIKKDIIASGYTYFWGRYGGRYPIYTANMSSVYDENKYNGQSLVNFKNRMMYLHMNLTEDGYQSLHMNGHVPDARSVVFDIWREYDNLIISDVAYYLKLNHSRLVTSSLKWRPELYDDVRSNIRGGMLKLYMDVLEGINNTKHYVKSETMDAMNGIWQDAKPIVQQFLDDLKNITVIEQDIEELKIFLTNSYEANDFYIKDITNITLTIFDELALKSHLQTLPKIFQELWSMMGQSGEKIKKSILWVMEEIKIYYKNTTDFIRGFLNGDPIDHVSKGLEKLLEKYDNYIKNLHITVLQYIESLWYQTYDMFVENWYKFLAGLEPTFLKFAHYLESMAYSTGRELLDFYYLRKSEFIESPFFVKFSKFSQDIDRFYKDITGNNTIAAVYKYSKIGWNFLKEKYIDEIPFGKELLDVVNEIIEELKQIGEIPSIKYLLQKWYDIYDTMLYYYDYMGLESKIQKLLFIMYKKFSELSITALDMEDRQREAKTKFIFEPNDGVMLLEQKLPMSWHAFNETPNFREIPEIKKGFELMDFFQKSQTTFWDIYYNYVTVMDSSTWFPPFNGRAMLIDTKYYVTFDKRYFDFEGNCTYLLANDFDDHNFTLLVSYDKHVENNELIIILHKTIVRVNLKKNQILVGDSKTEYLPAQIGEVYLYRESELFVMRSSMGFHLECNMKYEICTFEISGWYSGKTAGLWGTYNNEPSDDFPTRKITKQNDIRSSSFANDWSIDKNCKTTAFRAHSRRETTEEVRLLCEEFFNSKVSQLSDCFGRVPKDYFNSICLNATNKREACTAAVSYIDMCAHAHTPLRIPDTCVQCTTSNGTEIKEGEFIRYEGENVPKHADVVFILEAKSCNKNFKQSKNVEVLVELIEKELQQKNFSENRYALVSFGGDGVFDDPRAVLINGETFGNSRSILKYFDRVVPGNGNNDIFNAIVFAYNMIFRPEATRSFILIPCSECDIYNMEHDYATVHELLSEGAISLHILMNDHFKMQKEGETRIPYGIDKQYAYSKRDVRALVGDSSLRKSIHLPKNSLGQCLSLALETNGTVFSSQFLETDKKNAKKFATVYSQLIAKATIPPQCKDCECTALDNGISYMECYICTMTVTSKNNFDMLAFEGEDFTSINLFEEFNS